MRAMTNDAKSIHFGNYIRSRRLAMGGLTVKKMAQKIGITEPTLIAWESKSEPEMYDSNFAKIAGALGDTPEELNEKWRSTPVAKLSGKRGRMGRAVRANYPLGVDLRPADSPREYAERPDAKHPSRRQEEPGH